MGRYTHARINEAHSLANLQDLIHTLAGTKGSTMVQWINIFRNNSFVNPMRLPLLCRNYRPVALAEPGLTADWLAG